VRSSPTLFLNGHKKEKIEIPLNYEWFSFCAIMWRFNFNQLLYILLLSFGILFVQIDHSEWGEKHRNESGTHPKKNMWNGWGLL